MLLIEQNAELALDVSTNAYAMSLGEVTALGATDALPADFGLEEIYL